MRGVARTAAVLGMLVCSSGLAACSPDGDFLRDEREPETPPPPEPTCPDIADCSDRDCGLDPVCGVECGTCLQEETCLDSGSCCMPATCEELGADCGTVEDGCGGQLECGVCAFGMECNPGQDQQRSCTCPEAGDGDSVLIDIPTLQLVLQPTLNGAPPSEENTGEGGWGSFLIQPINAPGGVGWERVQLDLYDAESGTVRSELPMKLIPGDYSIFYKRGGDDAESPWPVNSRLQVDEQLSLSEDTVLPLAIETITVPVDLRIDGVPLADLPLSPGQVVEVTLSEPGLGPTRLANLSADDPESSFVLDQVTLVPGGYQIGFSNNLGQNDVALPFGYSSPIPLGAKPHVATIPLNSSGDPLSVDIESALVTMTLSMDGVLSPSVGFDPGDDPRIRLLPRSGGPPEGQRVRQDHGQPPSGENPPGAGQQRGIVLPPLWNATTGDLANNLEVRVVDGNYDVFYSHTLSGDASLDGLGRRWALNSSVLSENRTFFDGAEFPWNIPTVQIEVQASLDGVPLDSTLCEGGGGDLILKWSEPVPGSFLTEWPLPPVCDGELGVPRVPYSVHLVAGSYDLNYRAAATTPGPAWPTHGAPVTLDKSIDLLDSGELALNVPVIELGLRFTMNGGPLPELPAEQDVGTWPTVQLAELGMSPVTKMGWNPPASVSFPLSSETEVLQLIPSNYMVSYLAKEEGLGADWPNPSFKVDSAVLVETNAMFEYDLSYSRVEVAFALDGLAASEANTSELDHGRLSLVRDDPRATFEWVSSWSADAELPGEAQAVNLPQGTYFLLYYPSNFELSQSSSYANMAVDGAWPLSAGVQAGCILVE